MRNLSSRFHAAVAAIDAANAADPTQVEVRGKTVALALIHGRLASQWIEELVGDPDETLMIAARAHHLRRWELSRDSYPVGRAGYLRWRRDQKARHARDVAEILEPCGYEPAEIEQVQRLIRREAIDGSQDIEDAACLVFIETQLASIAERMDHDLLIDVIRKSAQKMSARGLDLVGAIPLGATEKSLLREALDNSA